MGVIKTIYFYDGVGQIDESYKDKLNLTGLLCTKKAKDVGYIYVLNIVGSDVCKIGTSVRVFDRVASIRQIIRCVFPLIEDAITYNIFISKPVMQRFELEKKLHAHFQSCSIDGEWFKCTFDDSIKILQNLQLSYIFEDGVNRVLSMIDDNKYKHHLMCEKFNHIKYLKCASNLKFKDFLTTFNPSLFDLDDFYLSDNCAPCELCLALEKYLDYIQSKELKDFPNLSNRKLYSYKSYIRKQLTNFIIEIKEGIYDAN